MAKSKNTTHDAPGHAGTVVVEIPAGLILTYGDWSIDAATASPATLAYCLANGFHQSMVDAAAFSKDEKEGKGFKAILRDAEVEIVAPVETFEQGVADDVEKDMGEQNAGTQ